MPSTRAVVVTAHGGRDVLAVEDREIAEPGTGELLVDVAASGVNFIDVYQREGIYPTSPPFVLGQEAAGRVTAVGADVTGVQEGDRVAWCNVMGTHAGRAIVPAARVVPVPDGVDDAHAAAAMLQGMTAHYLVRSTYVVQSADTALVHAAAGGVGQLLVQLIKSAGARVIATVGSAAKAEKAAALGADTVLRYDELTDTDELAAAVRRANGDVGVSVVYDGVGRATFEASLASLAPRGMLVLFGAASGQVPPFDLQRLNPAGSLFVTRPTLKDYAADRDELLWRSTDVLGSIADGTLQLEIGGRYGLADAAQAYADLEERRSTGKLLLIP